MSGECVPSAQHSTTFRMNLRDAYDHNLSRAICHLFMSFTTVIVFLFLLSILIFVSWATITVVYVSVALIFEYVCTKLDTADS